MSNRELAIKVATDVMKWTRCGDYWMDGEQVAETYHDFNPDSDISAAWAVVEKLREDDFWWSAVYKEVYIDPGLITQTGYEVKFRCTRGGTRGEYLGFADTLSEAICLAALKTKECKDE